jgi:2'-5' RNA ligase
VDAVYMGVRCFVSVDIEDAELLAAFERVQAVLGSTGADLKSVETGNLHITLRFLGDVPEADVEGVGEVVRGIAFKPFSLEVSGVGVFPSLSRPNVVWAGLEGERLPEMLRLFTELEGGLKRLGFEPERRGFEPHLTLCRVRSGRNRQQLAEAIMGLSDERFGELKVSHLRLKKSVLTGRGPIYSTLAESKSI